MDIKQLKNEIRKFIAACEAAGMHLEFVALVRFLGNSYILQVGGEWIDKHPQGRYAAHNLIMDKMYEAMSREAIGKINHLSLYSSYSNTKATIADHIFVNENEIELEYPALEMH